MAKKAPKPLSDQLREAIDASGMSRYRICKEIGLPESTMSHFMHRQCGLQLSTIDRLAALLDLRITTGPGAPEGPAKPQRTIGAMGALKKGKSGRRSIDGTS